MISIEKLQDFTNASLTNPKDVIYLIALESQEFDNILNQYAQAGWTGIPIAIVDEFLGLDMKRMNVRDYFDAKADVKKYMLQNEFFLGQCRKQQCYKWM